MVETIAIYIEGGGNTASTKSLLREGFSEFLREIRDIARKKRMGWRLIPCGGRSQTYAAFQDAIVKEPDVLNMLLVDSEEPVEMGVSPWTHLKKRREDGWNPGGVADENCHLMVACMEAWFLADPEGLKQYYGGNLDAARLPPPNRAESRTKADILEVLEKATKPTAAKAYHKIRDGAKLLKKINAGEVQKHCQWCVRLFTGLGQAVGGKK